jgi:toxin HigB-1
MNDKYLVLDTIRKIIQVIRSFQSKPLEKLFNEANEKNIPQDLKKKIQARLEVIDSALDINEIRLPGYDLHRLKGERQNTWSVKVSANWRITFRFEDSDAYDVTLEDYH